MHQTHVLQEISSGDSETVAKSEVMLGTEVDGREELLLEARVSGFRELGAPGPIYGHPVRRVNCHSVFLDTDLFLHMREEGKTQAGLRLIEDARGWQLAIEWVFLDAQHHGHSAPLSMHGDYYSSREKALEAGKEKIVSQMQDAAECNKQPEKAMGEVLKVRRWLDKAISQPEWFHEHTPARFPNGDPRAAEPREEESSGPEQNGLKGEGEQASLF